MLLSIVANAIDETIIIDIAAENEFDLSHLVKVGDKLKIPNKETVYVVKNEKIEFKADSDAIIVKGIVALLVKVLNGRTPAEILENELYFIEEIGLKQNLSPTRSNGLLAMVKKMKLYALAFQAKASQKL